MNRTIATFLVSTLFVSSIAGCTSNSTPENTTKASESETTTTAPSAETTTAKTSDSTGEDKVLTVALFKGGYGEDYWKQIVAKFEADNAGTKVNMIVNEDLGAVIKPQILAGNAPDFMYLPTTNPSGLTKALIKDKKLADITDVFETDGLKDKIMPGFIDSAMAQPYGDGKVYLAPLYYSALGLFYNKTLFTEANLKTPTTWDEFFALGDEIKGKQVAGKERALFTYQGSDPSYMEALIIPAVASAAGSKAMDNCFNYVEGSWKEANVIKTLDTIAKIGIDGYMLKGTPGLAFSAAQAAVKTGDALFIPCGNWLPGEMKDIEGEKVNDKEFEWGFSVAPVFDASGDKYLMTSLEEMYVLSDAKNMEMAKKFLAYQYTDDAIKLNAELSGGIPPVVGATEKVKDSLDVSTYEAFKAFDQGFKPYIGNFAPVDSNIIPKDEFYNPIGDVVQGKLTVEEWTNNMEKVSTQLRDKIVKAE